MAKLFSILAASVGGGLILGASIRLGEAIGSSAIGPASRQPANGTAGRESANGHAPGHQPVKGASPVTVAHPHVSDPLDPLITARLERLEERLARVNSGVAVAAAKAAPPPEDWQAALSGVVERMDRQQSEVETMRYQVTKATRAMDSMSAMAENLRGELQRAIGQDLDQRLTAIEESLQVSMEAANRETVDAMVASIEARVAPRISRLEADLAGQSSAVAELRECALQSERSIQRLLGVLEIVMNPPFGANENRKAAGSRGPDAAAGGSGELRRASSFRPLNPVI